MSTSNERTDKEYKKKYKKILESAPSRGGQMMSQKEINSRINKLNINTIKKYVKDFERREKKLKEMKEEKGFRTMKQLQKKYIEIYKKLYKKKTYTFRGKKYVKIPENVAKRNLKLWYKKKSLLERTVLKFEIYIKKTKKIIKKEVSF